MCTVESEETESSEIYAPLKEHELDELNEQLYNLKY